MKKLFKLENLDKILIVIITLLVILFYFMNCEFKAHRDVDNNHIAGKGIK